MMTSILKLSGRDNFVSSFPFTKADYQPRQSDWASRFILFLIFMAVGGISAAGQIYVKADASGNDDGTSWVNAYTNLRVALEEAEAGDEIWVAAGTYLPVVGKAERSDRFLIPDEVKVYGGFSGTETQLEERDWEANRTILSGDIGEEVTPTDNVYHVVQFRRVTNETLLDGFTISDGQADEGFPDDSGGGVYNNGANEMNSSRPIIRNCIFENNFATFGGAVYNDGYAGDAYMIFENCTFRNNAGRSGGAILNDGQFEGQSVAELKNCQFEDNAADVSGGGLYAWSNEGETRLEISNCVFRRNRADIGGAIYIDGTGQGVAELEIEASLFEQNEVSDRAGALYINGQNGNNTTDIVHCVFVNNRADLGGAFYNNAYLGEVDLNVTNCTFLANRARNGGAMYSSGYLGDFDSQILNTIFWNNRASNRGADFLNFATGLSVDYSLIQGADCDSAAANSARGEFICGDSLVFNMDPLFVDTMDVDGADDLFGTRDDGLRLQDNSPAQDRGLNDVAPARDLVGFNRPFDGDGDGAERADLGPYERFDCTDADIPDLAGDDQLCTGAPATISIIGGELNGADQWVWYQDGCGVERIGAGTSIQVLPERTTTYYVRGEGGCVVPGSCQSFVVRVGDNDAPTFTCSTDERTRTAEPANCTYQISGNELDPSDVVDNCSVASLTYEIFGATTGSGENTLDGVSLNAGTTLVRWCASDLRGNTNCCEFLVTVEDETGACPFGEGDIRGKMLTENNLAISEVEVTLEGEISSIDLTDESGDYRFDRLPEGFEYTIRPVYDKNHRDGISTLDLILIARHILSIESLDSPYKIIAADANRSKTITTLDLVILRRLILGLDTRLADNTSWRFVNANYTFPDPGDPFLEDFPEEMQINSLSGMIEDANFVGLKVGDVNFSVTTTLAQTRSNDEGLELSLEDQYLQAGETYRLPLRAAGLNRLQGYQFTMHLDTAALQLESVHPLIGQAENYGFFPAQGKVTTSWFRVQDGGAYVAEESLFELVFTAKRPGRLSDYVGIDYQPTVAEAYAADDSPLPVKLNYSAGQASQKGFELHAKYPNPFRDQANLVFNLPQEGQVLLTIRDARGRTILQRQRSFPAGTQTWTLRPGELPAGILFFTLSNERDQVTHRMVKMD